MNVFGALFGIFRGKGLAESIREGRPMAGFVIFGMVAAALSGGVYGLAMGIGIDVDTALKDAIKIAVVLLLSFTLSLPVFFLSYRLLGRDESFGQVAAVALAGVLSCAMVLGVAAPVVFLYGVASGFAPELLYVHVALVDVAALLGIFLLGNLAYHAFPTNRQGLVVPNVIGVFMVVLVAVVSVSFFRPFLQPSSTFSTGTDRLLDSMGIGVKEKVTRALRSAVLTDRIEYHYRLVLPEEGTERDFTVVRAGENYQLTIRRLARLGQPTLADRRVWLVEGKAYSDFGGQAIELPRKELSDFLEDALPSKAFAPPEQGQVSYRARLEEVEGKRYYVARGSMRDQQVTVLLNPDNRELVQLEITPKAAPALVGLRISNIRSGTLTSVSLQASLARAMESIQNPSDPRFREAWETQVVVASLERPDPTSFDYINPTEYFALRYPRSWQQEPWDAGRRSVSFVECPESRCARMTVEVGGLERNKSLQDLLIELRNKLMDQPRNHNVTVSVDTVRGTQIGVVDYSYDYFEGGRLVTAHQIQYWYLGRVARYSLTATAAVEDFEKYHGVFGSAAQSFEYLR